jgi:hypothetical protein
MLLAACHQAQEKQAPAQAALENHCARSAVKEITWSNDAHPDVVSAVAQGPSCAQAVVTFTIRNAAGDPLWAFASTYYDMTAGGVAPADAPAITDEQMDRFLNGWVNVTLNHSGDLPEWKAGAQTLAASVQGMSYNTDFERETYEMLRARNLPQVCFAAAVEASHCLVVDPMSNAPTLIVAYGP